MPVASSVFTVLFCFSHFVQSSVLNDSEEI